MADNISPSASQNSNTDSGASHGYDDPNALGSISNFASGFSSAFSGLQAHLDGVAKYVPDL